MIGTIAGNYRLTERLAGGGMGEVFAAEHQIMGRKAAVKFLRPEFSANQTVIGRFFNEARAAAQINHPGIVEVFDVGFVSGRAFLVMELLQGETLSDRIARRRITTQEAVLIARQIASVLAATHAHSIVHRDLKPDNIFLVPDPEVPMGERVKIVDFGIAKVASSSSNTQTGAIFGTPAYMAPEQCISAGVVDHRADLYSLGCIIFELVAGTPPFGRGGMELVGSQISEIPPALDQRVQGVPRELSRTVAQLLEKDRNNRPQSCDELGRQLGMLPGQAPTPVPGTLKRLPSQKNYSKRSCGDTSA